MAKITTDYVFDTATDINGMTKHQIVCFHLFNPNGLVAKLPDFDDFCNGSTFFVGCEALYGRHNNHHANWLREACDREISYTKWDLMYHLDRLTGDVDKAWTVLAEKKAA